MSVDSKSSDLEPPKIEFPCLYPIKIIGKASACFQDEVIAVVERHTGKLDADLIKVRPSRQQNYLSVTVTIAATGEDQIRRIFNELKIIENVKMVL